MSKHKLTKKQKEELQSLVDDITFEAKELRLDYEKNPSEISGSITQVHENSPFLKEKHERLISFGGKQHKIEPDSE